MEKIKVNLENCFGIKKLQNHEFDFTNSNVNLIYAKNGSMKTSFAKVFKKIQEGEEDEICDEIFGEPTSKSIKIINGSNEENIDKDNIFVIKSFENSYESESISSLLINNELKEKLKNVLKLKNNFLKILVGKSGLKISKKSGGKTIFELEPQILKDFGKENKSFLQILDCFNFSCLSYDFSGITYNDIFKVLVKIKSNEFQNNINDFLDKNDEIYSNSNFLFLKKGKFTLGKLKNIEKNLKNSNFFVKENKILFTGGYEIDNIGVLEDKIKEIEDELYNTNEFKILEKLFQDAGGIILKDIIENNPDIIEELKTVNILNFRKKLWLSYIKEEEIKFNELKNKYDELKTEIDELNIDKTSWKEAIDMFNDRFSLPFKMEIENLTSSIIGENTPKIVFSFCKDGNFANLDPDNWKKLSRDDIEGKDTLSQGEKRALYLLNIIFDIENFKKEIKENPNREILFIIDDIADSFDYKNKYAIVEYLKEISEEPNFYSIILTHNFDFFRFIKNRLNLKNNSYESLKDNNGNILLNKSLNKEPWEIWKEDLNEKNVIALIPFVRNLIEYGLYDKEDFMILTHLLHKKEKTKYNENGKKFSPGDDESKSFEIEKTEDINFNKIEKIYKKYLIKNDFSITDGNIKIYSHIKSMIELDSDLNLENKIIYAIKIRYYSEEFMKKEISIINPSTNFNNIKSSQFGWLLKKYNNLCKNSLGTQFLEQSVNYNRGKDILNSVNIMTPENIHLNSFMYEPILDMDITELKKLYEKVKSLNPGT